jgi:hypothetical protein
VGSGSDWTLIASGGYHACGLRAGQAYCWGRSEYGETGNVTPSWNSPTLVEIYGTSEP